MSAEITEDALALRPLKALTLGERVIDPDDIPWVPYEGHPGIFVKPLRLNRKTGVWANLTKVVGASQINRHYHVGPVTGLRAGGQLVLRREGLGGAAGMIVWEPPGDIHTLMSNEEGTVTLFMLEGALLYVDEHDNVVGYDDVLNHMKPYHDYCESQGIEPLDLDY